jgi:hypothetical protein
MFSFYNLCKVCFWIINKINGLDIILVLIILFVFKAVFTLVWRDINGMWVLYSIFDNIDRILIYLSTFNAIYGCDHRIKVYGRVI